MSPVSCFCHFSASSLLTCANLLAIWLQDIDSVLFQRFVDWLYKGEYLKEDDEEEERWKIILELHVMAERWDITKLHNNTIDAIIVHLEDYGISEALTQKAWENISSSSRYHTLLIDYYVYGESGCQPFSDFDTASKLYNPEFIFQLGKRISREILGPQPWSRAQVIRMRCENPVRCI